MTKQKCPNGHEFESKVEKPKRCPQCNCRMARNSERAPVVSEDLERSILKAIGKRTMGLAQLSEEVDRGILSVKSAIESLGRKGHNLRIREDKIELSSEVKPGAGEPLIVHNLAAYKNQWRKFGACGDNHLGSRHERLDVLNALYDVYADEGVTEVFNTGNWIEGNSRLNYHDVKVFGMDDQIDYFIEHYPQRGGITTYFVAGDDHEGWFQKSERIEIGKHAELMARDAGREDLKYLGYVEADIEFKAKSGSSWLKVMHPGGGSAYALSYAAQKLVESLQGGEKPHVLLYGHYHKFDYNFAREVHCVGTGCTVDQSIFMRKCKIQAHLGGTLIHLNQAPEGHINRFRVEWMPFYDRGFYAPKRRQFGLTGPGYKKAA